MKTLFRVWIRGPYGPWEDVTEKPLPIEQAEQVADIYRAGTAQLVVKVVRSNDQPFEKN